jgi:uncharacterized protein YndB with AHSA1/START domain
MTDLARFKPGTVYVTYIAATPERVWQALIDPSFTRQYFFGLTIHIEPKEGGDFRLLMPDGGVHVAGKVLEWSPPRRLCVTWRAAGVQGFAELPECIVSFDVAPAGGSVRLKMTESHSWAVPDAILQGGRAGWPKILSGLKSVLETGKPLDIEQAGPPAGFINAVHKAVAEKPWLKG